MILRHCLLVLLGLALFSGCQSPRSTPVNETAAPVEPALVSHFGRDFPLSAVQEAVVQSLQQRQWQVTSTEADAVEAALVHRRYEAGIRVVLTPNSLTIYSDSWRLDRDGNRERREHPEGWLRNIERDVRRSLQLPN